jgi:hypothetical protein
MRRRSASRRARLTWSACRVRVADGPGFLAALLACLRAGHPAALTVRATADETTRLIRDPDLAGRAVATAQPRGAGVDLAGPADAPADAGATPYCRPAPR